MQHSVCDSIFPLRLACKGITPPNPLFRKIAIYKSIAYICNPDKTDGELYVSSFGCSAQTAYLEFAFANGKNIKNGDNLAHHLIQSFAPGEVSFDEAHQIGKELADRLLGGKYSYVIATHIEKDHVHNHIIFCATDNIDHKKYNTCKKSYSIELKEGIFMAVTNNIREIREQRGIYQDDLAAAIGFSTKTVGRIERGDSTPSAEFMLRISKYFNMLVEDVFHVED